jgi:Carboxypeptidase regulatory-like domain
MTRTLGKILRGLAVVLVPVSMALGQTTFGSITGTVTDPSGAVVPGVSVTLTDLSTAGKQLTTTNSVGLYEFRHSHPNAQYHVAESREFMAVADLGRRAVHERQQLHQQYARGRQ